MKYYKYYIQKESEDAPVKETGADFDIYEVDSKFYGGASAKELPKRSWNDEHGDDEFVPDELMMESLTHSVKFGYKGDKFSANAVIKSFLDYLSKGGSMKIYDEYNGIGRQHVRFSSMSDDAELVRDEEGDILIFTVTLKVNDPVTDIVLGQS